MENTTDTKNTANLGVGYSGLLAALNARLEHAEKRYRQEQQDGDAISIASTRASFLGWRDARELVKQHISANTEVSLGVRHERS